MGCQASSVSSVEQAPKKASMLPPARTLLADHESAKMCGSDAQAAAPAITEGASAALPTRICAAAMPHTGDAPADDDSEAEVPLSSTQGPNSGHDTLSQGLLKRQRTLCTNAYDLDVMVTEFISHDSTVGSVIGRNCKEMQWKVMYDRAAAPIDIKLQAQEHKLHFNEVSIESDGQHIFQGADSHSKAKMIEDFRYQWPFRAMIRGINELHFYEFHPPHVSPDVWFPATITCQREDGYFEVRAQEVDMNGRIMNMTYPAVHRDSLRVAASGKPIAIPENCLKLEVPKQDPLRAALRVGNGELVTHHFGRPSPPLTEQKREIALKVSKDRKVVTANVGHGTLWQFVAGEVSGHFGKCEVERLRHSWTVQIGPFAEHKVEIMKRYTLGKIVTLLVDGKVLVEASAVDIGCEGNEWQCKFRFVGERILDFEVYKTNTDGDPLDETDHVKERRKYVHECVVVIPNDWDFRAARLFVDGIPFNELPMTPHQHDEPNLTMNPMAMLNSYGISTPYKVDPTAPSNIMVWANRVMNNAEESRRSAGGFFAQCYECNTVAEDAEVV